MEAMETNEMDVLDQNLSQNSQNEVIYGETETSFIGSNISEGSSSSSTIDQENRNYLQNNVLETIVGLDSPVDNSSINNNEHAKIVNCNRGEKSTIHVVPNLLDNKLKYEVPKAGTPVTTKDVKRAGPYVLGPMIGTSPVKSIVQCLAKKSGTDQFYTIKFLALKNPDEEETQDDRQGKMLLHVEYTLSKMLRDLDGVIHHHAFFKDCALEQKVTEKGVIFTGKVRKRLCLVLDCLISHELNPKNDELLNLKHHVIKEKKLSEKETLLIFADTVKIVASFHNRNIVHRDLKLGNLVLNRRSKKVTITNFCLGKYLSREDELLKDQLGSPAYISPDVLIGKPYLGKPSDMWALGVILFTMLYGQLPFYDSSPTLLFHKIKAANYVIPNDKRVSEGTQSLIKNLLVLQPSKRLTAIEVLDSLSSIIATFKVPVNIGDEEQLVPEVELYDKKEESKNNVEKERTVENINAFDKKLSEFSRQITMQEQAYKMQEEQQVPPQLPQTRLFGQIPVYRVDSDARELTPSELDSYGHLIPQENQRSNIFNNNREANSRLNDRNRSLFNGPINVRELSTEQYVQSNNVQISNNTQDQRFVNYSTSVVPTNVPSNVRPQNDMYSARAMANSAQALRNMINHERSPYLETMPNFNRTTNEANDGRTSTESLPRQWPINRGTGNHQPRTSFQHQDFSMYSTDESNADSQSENRSSQRLQRFSQRLSTFYNNLRFLANNYPNARNNNVPNSNSETSDSQMDLNQVIERLRNQRNMLRGTVPDSYWRLLINRERMLENIRSHGDRIRENIRLNRERILSNRTAGSPRRTSSSQNRHLPYLRNNQGLSNVLVRQTSGLSSSVNLQGSPERRANASREDPNRRQAVLQEFNSASVNSSMVVGNNSTDNTESNSNSNLE